MLPGGAYQDFTLLPLGPHDILHVRHSGEAHPDTWHAWVKNTSAAIRAVQPNWRGFILVTAYNESLESMGVDGARALHATLGTYLAEVERLAALPPQPLDDD